MKQGIIYNVCLLTLLFSVSFETFAKNDARAPRYFSGYKSQEAGLLVPIPINPKWDHSLEESNGNTSVVISSPSTYYPSATLEFTLHKNLSVKPEDLPAYALAALNKFRRQSGALEKESINDFEYVEYGEVKGYVDTLGLTLNNKPFSVKYLFGLMPSNQPVLLTVGAPRGQMAHIEHVVTKIWNKLSVLPNALPENNLSAK